MSTSTTEPSGPESPAPGSGAAARDNAWLPYVAPMGAFLLLTSLEGYLPRAGAGEAAGPHPTYYPLFYAAKIAIVAGLALAFRSAWRDLRPAPRPLDLALAVGIGLAAIVAWVGLDGLYPVFGSMGKRQAFDLLSLPSPVREVFLVARGIGLVLLVPLIEELFWRSFVWRYVIDPDFESVPIGKATPAAVALTSVLFASVHPAEWLPALLTGLAWAWLLWKTKRLSACLVSHAVANLALGAYVLATGDWKYL